MDNLAEESIKRNINTHGTKRSLVEVLEDYEGQFVLMKENGVLYSQTTCRCASPHVDIFPTKALAEEEALTMPRAGLSIWELNSDFYSHYIELRAQAIEKYNPMRFLS